MYVPCVYHDLVRVLRPSLCVRKVVLTYKCCMYLIKHTHTPHTHRIVTLEISCYSIYKRWYQLYTAYNGEEQLQSPLDTDGFANLEASLPNSYVMDAMDELRVTI